MDEKKRPPKYKITLTLDMATGALNVESEVPSQVMAIGMLNMGSMLLAKAEPPKPRIEVASALPAGMTPGHS